MLGRLMQFSPLEVPVCGIAHGALAVQRSVITHARELDNGVLKGLWRRFLVVGNCGFGLFEALHLCLKVSAMELLGLINVDR